MLGVEQGNSNRALAYDSVGNIVTDAQADSRKQLVYGSNNRLQRVNTPEGLTEYVYNARGQRVIKRILNTDNASESEVASEVHFHYGLGDQLIAETNGDGQLLKDYMYLGRERLAVVDYTLQKDLEDALPREAKGAALAANRHGEMLFVHNDHLGAPQLMTDASQTIVWQVDRQPFGAVDTRVAKLELRAGFPGQYFEGESGYVYNYFRDYDPTLGRYLQSDPIGLKGGINTFGMC